MGTIFRTATKQAILDLIADHGTRSRFGQLLSDDDADALAHRVVDLFEMTLELRARTGLMLPQESGPSGGGEGSPSAPSARRSAASTAQAPRSWSDEAPAAPFPTTIHAAEFLDRGEPKARVPDAATAVDDPVLSGLKLPRTRKPITDSERQSFLRRR